MLHGALALVAPSVTAAELEARFASFGATLEPDVAGRLLAQLADLGLVRAARQDGDGGTRFVTTTLGARWLAGGLGGDAAVSLAELEALRTDLLSTIAHELRTPLTAVRTSVGLLLDPTAQPTDAQRAALLESDRAQRRAHAAARQRHPRPLPGSEPGASGSSCGGSDATALA